MDSIHGSFISENYTWDFSFWTFLKSYNDLKESVSAFERTEFIQVNIQRSRSIDSAAKRAPSKVYNEDLRYREIDFVYAHGGKCLYCI